MVYASTRDWSSLYGTMRFESETASLPRPARTSSAVNFTVTPAENFVSPFSESSPSPRLQKKKKSVSPHDSQFIQANVRHTSKFILSPLDSAFD